MARSPRHRLRPPAPGTRLAPPHPFDCPRTPGVGPPSGTSRAARSASRRPSSCLRFHPSRSALQAPIAEPGVRGARSSSAAWPAVSPARAAGAAQPMNSTRSALPAFISDCRTTVSQQPARRRARTTIRHPRDDHSPVLERLTQTLDRVAAELRELVEEQHPVVPQGVTVFLDATCLRGSLSSDPPAPLCLVLGPRGGPGGIGRWRTGEVPVAPWPACRARKWLRERAPAGRPGTCSLHGR
jgi:hypothetical protein